MSTDPSEPFFKTPPKTITRAEADRLRRECKEHQVVVEGKVALHFVRDENGIIYLVDQAKAD